MPSPSASLQGLPGFGQVEYDFIAAPKVRQESRRQIRKLWRDRGASRDGNGAQLLMGADGRLDTGEFRRILGQRDERPVELFE